jgi:hypothetical protein
MIWNPGDDTDLFEGGDGTDTAQVNGGNDGLAGNDIVLAIDVAANGIPLARALKRCFELHRVGGIADE